MERPRKTGKKSPKKRKTQNVAKDACRSHSIVDMFRKFSESKEREKTPLEARVSDDDDVQIVEMVKPDCVTQGKACTETSRSGSNGENVGVEIYQRRLSRKTSAPSLNKSVSAPATSTHLQQAPTCLKKEKSAPGKNDSLIQCTSVLPVTEMMKTDSTRISKHPTEALDHGTDEKKQRLKLKKRKVGNDLSASTLEPAGKRQCGHGGANTDAERIPENTNFSPLAFQNKKEDSSDSEFKKSDYSSQRKRKGFKLSRRKVKPTIATESQSEKEMCEVLIESPQDVEMNNNNFVESVNTFVQQETEIKTTNIPTGKANKPRDTSELSTRRPIQSDMEINSKASVTSENFNKAMEGTSQTWEETGHEKFQSVAGDSKCQNQADEGECHSDSDNVPGGAEENNMGEESQPEGEATYRIPYYLENFQLILKTVLADEHYCVLFNEDDMKIVETFNNLTEDAQKVYVRLFLRKFKWLRKSKIDYPKIAADLSGQLAELVDCGLMEDDESLQDLPVVLESLPAPDLRSLAKTLHLNVTNQTCDNIMAAVMQHSKQKTMSMFLKQPAGGTAVMILKRAKKLLGPCYRVSKQGRDVFVRAAMLFSLHNITGEEDETAGAQVIFQTLMTNIGRIVYPKYEIVRETRIFSSRDHLLRYETAIMLENDMREAAEKKDFVTAEELYNIAKRTAQHLKKDPDTERQDFELPEHLRGFTAMHVYTYMLTLGVDVLEKLRRYKEAVGQLEELVSQHVYLQAYRGRWFDRLALDLEQHMKQPDKALDIIKQGLACPYVRTGRRYSLFQRADRICHAPGHKRLHKRWKEFKEDYMCKVREPCKKTITGRRLTHVVTQGTGTYSAFITAESYQQGNEDITFVKRVEDLVLLHYEQNGYPEGIHGEGGTFTFLFFLFLWDAVFSPNVPDAFLNSHQTAPLDLRCDGFYIHRKESFDEELEKIRRSSTQELEDRLAESWNEHQDISCVGVNWERFHNVDHCKGLVRCMGGAVLAGIFERMAKDMRNTTGGVPDLVVWNPETSKFKVSEVKGPGDRLSTKQILWLDYLVGLGVDAEVCHVEAVGAKMLSSH